MTAPDAEEADEEGVAARIDRSRCIHDGVISDGDTSHVARTRTDGRRTLGQGEAPRTAVIYLCLFILVICST